MLQACKLPSVLYKYLRLGLMLIALPTYLWGQSVYQFQAFTQAGGVTNNTIRDILEDPQGFIWLATDNGLSRFDGQHFLRFRFDPGDPNSISSNQVNILNLDSKQNLWIGTNTGLNRLSLLDGKMERIPLVAKNKSLTPYHIRCLLEDDEQNIWVGTQENGLFKLSPNVGKNTYSIKEFPLDPSDSTSRTYTDVTHLVEDDQGHIWVGSSLGIDRLDKQTETFSNFTHPILARPETYITNITKDHQGHILFAIQTTGVFYFDPGSVGLPTIQPYFDLDFRSVSTKTPLYTHIFQDREGLFWLGTDNGLIVIDSSKSKYRVLKRDPAKVGSLSSSAIKKIYETRDGRIWIGSKGGLNRRRQQTDQFSYNLHQYDASDQNSISSGQIRTITEDVTGKFWIGYLGSGLEQFGWEAEEERLVKLQHFKHDPSQKGTLLSNDIILVYIDQKGFLWIGTNGQGLNRLDPQTGKIQAFVHDPNDSNTLSGNRIWGICEDQDGFMWIGEFTTGLNRLDPTTGQVKRFSHKPGDPNSLSHNRIKSMIMDTNGFLWIGTNAGLNRFDISSGKFTKYFHDPNNEQSLSSNFIFTLYEDKDNNLWVGTALGINKVSRLNQFSGQNTLLFDRFYESDGLPSNTIYGIQGDNQGNLWVGTDSGLAKLLSQSEKVAFSIFDYEKKLRYTNYPINAHWYSESKNRIFFGSKNGLLSLQDHSTVSKRPNANILLGEISRYSFDGKKSTSSTDPFIASTEKLKLDYHDRIVIFKFSDPDWQKSKIYEYQLKGFSQEWQKLPERMEATFTDLAAGNYTLMARGRDGQNQALPAIQLLQISMYPPWWKSTLAYLLYVLSTMGLLYFLYRFQIKRQNEFLEKENLEKLNALKDRLYTNITHEFRTPLTVINGMLEQISGHEKARTLIKRNSDNLLHLINQILDLRKLRSVTPKLEIVQSNIVAYLQHLLTSLEALGELKNIRFQFTSKDEQLWMDFDPEKIERVITNLISNAIKFTQDNGNIFVHIERINLHSSEDEHPARLKIKVTDTGIGIPPSHINNIFDRFYQVEQNLGEDNGSQQYTSLGPGGSSGIGLALSKELTELMGGEISVHSLEGEGTTFTILLPMTQLATKVDSSDLLISRTPNLQVTGIEDIAQASSQIAPTQHENSNTLSLLIIEDNTDVVQYLLALLDTKYQVFVAKDGEEGISMAIDKIPDLILSDVMMPKKNGFEVCDTLKNDQRTSHIPIVLLTARSSVVSRLAGLRRGADAYLAKPFEQEELLLQLANLSKLRLELQKRYQSLGQQAPAENAEEPIAYQIEDAFISQLTATVKMHMHDPAFSTNELCRAMGMSRTQLHRKVTALANRSTSNFIRTVRLYCLLYTSPSPRDRG